MEPFRQLLDGDELVGAVVELMPDGVKGLIVLSLDTGVGGAPGVPGKFFLACAMSAPGPTPTQ